MAGSRRKKKSGIRKVIILPIVFVAAIIVYFTWSFFNTETEMTVYSSMEEPTLPVVYAKMYGKYSNILHGYLQDMGNEAASDCLTVLPSDRKLELQIAEYNNMVTGLSYEIRSLDLSHYIENTEVSDMERSDDGFLHVKLPIQNLIEKDKEYLLSIHLDTGEKNVNYYTRIIWTDSTDPMSMMDFAVQFTQKTFDYNAARDLVTYLETSPTETNDDLGRVTIDSNFSQLTWGDTDMRLTTDIDLRLKEYEGIMSVVEADYMTERTNELGKQERYRVKDRFTMRMGNERIYLMNYERTVNQIFEGEKQLFTGKRILLGIEQPDSIESLKSENGRYIIFKVNKELWCYDQKNKDAVNVFSFRSGVDDGVRANYDEHDIKILSVENNGNVDFVVYGYMNRGRHEGYNGIAYYRYNKADDTISESFFIPLTCSYEKIRLGVETLCKKSERDMLYLMQDNSIKAIDLRSGEMMDIAGNLSEDGYAVSEDMTELAFTNGGKYDSAEIRIMNLETGESGSIETEAGENLQILGFMEDDLIYGVSSENDVWEINGSRNGFPMHRLIIADSSFNVLKTYEKEGQYIENVRIEDSRIQLSNLTKTGDNSYAVTGSDTIVYNNGEEDTDAVVSSYISDDKKRIYYVQLDEEIMTTRSVSISAPGKISYERSANIEFPYEGSSDDKPVFYAYVNGELKGRSENFMKAMDICYDGIGYIKAGNIATVYNRANKTGKRSISDPESAAAPLTEHFAGFDESRIFDEEGIIAVKGRGMDSNQMLYFVYKGTPVILRTSEESYQLVSGFDEFGNIEIYDPGSGNDTLLGEEEARNYFESLQNDFISFVNITR